MITSQKVQLRGSAIVISTLCKVHSATRNSALAHVVQKQGSQTSADIQRTRALNMPFSFSFSSSAAFVGSGSVNGRSVTKGWAYKREEYSDSNGYGVRTTKQKLGEAPVTQTRIYDAQGRPLLVEGGHGGPARADPNLGAMRVIEDVTEEDQPTRGSR